MGRLSLLEHIDSGQVDIRQLDTSSPDLIKGYTSVCQGHARHFG